MHPDAVWVDCCCHLMCADGHGLTSLEVILVESLCGAGYLKLVTEERKVCCATAGGRFVLPVLLDSKVLSQWLVLCRQQLKFNQ